MKKILSLVLVLAMVLGLSVPAFAATPSIIINGTALDLTSEKTFTSTDNSAIKSGSVKFTPAKDSTPATLTLDNAKIETAEAKCIDISKFDNLIITLIGNNELTSSSFVTLGIYNNTGIVGEGNLTVTTGGYANAVAFGSNMTLSVGMKGTLTCTSSHSYGLGLTTSSKLQIESGAGKVIVIGGDKAFNDYSITPSIPDGYKVLGSITANAGEADLVDAVIADTGIEGVANILVGGETAKTVLIYNPNAKPTEDPTAKSDFVTITANVAKPELEYEIVIPQAVTMNEAGVKEIGAASIDTAAGKLKNATANTVISYTASGTNFKLKTDSSKTMAATYYSAYTDASTNTVLDSTKAIDVYKNSALVNPLTKLYVGVSQDDWDAAAISNPGTYTATVTFNFSAEEKEATKKFETVGEVLATVEGGFPDEANPWEGDFEEGYEPPSAYKSESNVLSVDCEHRALITYDTSVSESQTTPGDYVAVKEEFNSTFHAYMAWTITFHMTDNVLTSIDAKLDYYANSTGEKTQELTTYNHTNIAPTVGEPK